MLCHQTFTLEGSSDYQPEPTVCPASAIELSAIQSCHNMHSFSVLKQAGFQTNAVLGHRPPPHRSSGIHRVVSFLHSYSVLG